MSDKRGKGFRRNPGADSRAAPCGASGRAAGGAAVVLERLSTRGVATRIAVGPPARAHRRDEPDASPRRRSCRPSVLRGCVRAAPRAPRVGQGVRSPAAGADAVRGPRSASGSPGPARPGAEPTRRPAASPPLAPPPRPRRRGRSLTASRGGRCPPRGPPTGPGSPTRR